jgi:hypothetical protein
MANSVVAAVLGAGILFSMPVVHAQSNRSETAPPSSLSKQKECPADIANGAPRLNETTGSRPLSDQLSQSKGVICPPAGVDPGISVPPVGGGRTPVIPPPGTPGGDPSIQPK